MNMSDPEGVLPGSGSIDLGDAGTIPRLPTVAETRSDEERLPPATAGGSAPAPAVAKKIEPPPRMQKAADQAVTQILVSPPALSDRLAAATLAGGLTELPADFGDTGGDWATVRSENSFEVLYLDYRRAERITPEIVSRHRELLQQFWREKLRSMSQGAARLAILKKYGGEHESDRLVRSYPELIENAYHRLSTRGGIEGTYQEIVIERQKLVFARIDEKLSDYLIDSELQPEEMTALLEFADREEMAREVVAAHVQDRIRAAGLVNEQPVSGATLEQQLLSTAWVHPSRRAETPTVPVPQPRSRMPLVLSLAALLALVVGGVLFFDRTQTPRPASEITGKTSGKDEGAPPPVVEVKREPPIENTPEPNPNALPPVPPRVEDRGPRNTIPTIPAETPAEVTVSAADRQAAASELEEIRTLSTTDPGAALERAQRLDSQLADHPREFADERIALADLRSQINTAIAEQRFAEESQRIKEQSDLRAEQERAQKWEQTIAQIVLLSERKNFSGAKDLADQLLKEPDLPEPYAARARELANEAVASLQAIFSKSTVKSKTKRSPNPPL